LKVNLELKVYDDFDPDAMASDIDCVVSDECALDDGSGNNEIPDALLVSIPSQSVQDAVERAVRRGVPVFGLNSGYQVASQIGTSNFVAMPEYEAGVAAGEQFLTAAAAGGSGIRRAVFVTNQPENTALQLRLQGYTDALANSSDSTGAAFEDVDVLQVSGAADDDTSAAFLRLAFGSCPYDAVLLGSADAFQQVLNELRANNCTDTLVGTFDENPAVYKSIRYGSLLFAVSQQAYLQGALPVVMATIFATTGLNLVDQASSGGVYVSGPVIVTKETLDSGAVDTSCSVQGFPVCDGVDLLGPAAGGGSDGDVACACTNRADVVIGGVTHGVLSDVFWNQVNAAFRQGADDMSVQLKFEPFAERTEGSSALFAEMAERITEYCGPGEQAPVVDALFVTLPSEDVVQAIEACRAKVPVIGLNAGINIAQRIGVQYLGQSEYQAGYQSGVRMAQTATDFYCLHHAQGVDVVDERCDGFRDGLVATSPNANYTNIFVDPTNRTAYMMAVEGAVGVAGDWEGIGLFLAGQPNHLPGIELLGKHLKATAGAIDVSDALYQALDDGIILFGVDQQPYLQGYFAIPLLTLAATTGETLLNPLLETGPSFVTTSPSAEQVACQTNYNEVCGSGGNGSSQPPSSDSAGTSTTLHHAEPASRALKGIASLLALLLSFAAL